MTSSQLISPVNIISRTLAREANRLERNVHNVDNLLIFFLSPNFYVSSASCSLPCLRLQGDNPLSRRDFDVVPMCAGISSGENNRLKAVL